MLYIIGKIGTRSVLLGITNSYDEAKLMCKKGNDGYVPVLTTNTNISLRNVGPARK